MLDRLIFLLMNLCWVLGGCSSLSLTLEGARSLPVDHGHLQVVSLDFGSPTVVFETGAGSEMSVWRGVVRRLGPSTSTFIYNRSGYGSSRLVPSPQSGSEIVESLRRGLRAAGHAPPYLLVGHSLGGLTMNLFARSYPEEVIGVVLVDSSHPDQFETFREEMPWVHSLLVASYAMGPAERRYELEAMRKAQAEFQGAPRFPAVPLVVLTAGRMAPWENPRTRELWLEFQEDLTKMSPLGRQILAENSGHFIQRSQPELVAESIHELLSNTNESFNWNIERNPS